MVPILHLHTHVYLWTKLGLTFLKNISRSLQFGFVILMMSSLFGLMVKRKAQVIFGRFEHKFHPNIKFSHEVNKESIRFLDLNVRLSDRKISTDLHVKRTYRHQFIYYTLSHPDHTKRSIVFSEAPGVSRI